MSTSRNPFVGSWTYRSLLNDPDPKKQFNDLQFGLGTIVIEEAVDGAHHHRAEEGHDVVRSLEIEPERQHQLVAVALTPAREAHVHRRVEDKSHALSAHAPDDPAFPPEVEGLEAARLKPHVQVELEAVRSGEAHEQTKARVVVRSLTARDAQTLTVRDAA